MPLAPTSPRRASYCFSCLEGDHSANHGKIGCLSIAVPYLWEVDRLIRAGLDYVCKCEVRGTRR
jgi:hypothetical protein